MVPNTLESEKYAPTSDGTVTDNLIYWNNFNYFKSDSKVKPLPAATGSFNYPTGVGVVVFGATNWKVSNNQIFGNFKWGVFNVSDPAFEPATNHDDSITGNTMGGALNDANGVDFMSEGSGTNNCWADNGAAARSTRATRPTSSCTRPAARRRSPTAASTRSSSRRSPAT